MEAINPDGFSWLALVDNPIALGAVIVVAIMLTIAIWNSWRFNASIKKAQTHAPAIQDVIKSNSELVKAILERSKEDRKANADIASALRELTECKEENRLLEARMLAHEKRIAILEKDVKKKADLLEQCNREKKTLQEEYAVLQIKFDKLKKV